MSHLPRMLIVAAGLSAGLAAQAEYRLVWSEDFEGPAIDSASWNHETFPGVESGNDELQHYTDRPANSFIEDGCLVIQALNEDYKGHRFTSARLHTKGKREFRYGKIEARIKLPSGAGMWPAFWMMPAASAYGTWAASGEIDIVESTNIPEDVFGTIHFGGRWPHNVHQGARYAGPEGAPVGDFSNDFHVFTLEWQPYEMRWYVDGNLYSVQHEWHTTDAPYPAPFDKAFYIILNVAVGGRLPGPPDDTTSFPQRMLVDWVKVYQTENDAPRLEVHAPAPNTRVAAGAPVVFEIDASDPDGDAVTVEIRHGEGLVASLREAPYRYSWDAGEGLYPVAIRALDSEGFARTITRDVIVGRGIPRRPYHGTPASVPGRIQAAEFDEGMPGDAYHDNDKINHGNAHRQGQPVDIQDCLEGGYNLGWVEDGEWVTYTVHVAEAGDYVPSFRVASPEGAGVFRLEVDGGPSTGSVGTPRTGDWQKYETVTGPRLHLAQGDQVLRLVVEKGGTNITWFSLYAETTP